METTKTIKTKAEKQLAKAQKAIVAYIAANKFLKDKKYYKNNYWSMAAWDSWAAQGKCGGCATCNAKYYNGTLCNKRSNKWCKHVSANFCYHCIGTIEILLNHKFQRH